MRVAASGLAATVTAGASARAQPLPSSAPLPPVPSLQLVMPQPPSSAGAGASAPFRSLRREGKSSLWLNYWAEARAPAAWRGFDDAELRLNVETGRWELGRLMLSTQISSVPERERDCHPDCRGPAWSAAARLKYDLGDVGFVKHAGPELEVGGASAQPRTPARGLIRGGFSGEF